MVPGYNGHLVSHHYLESMVASLQQTPERHARRGVLVSWRRSAEWLGPASSLRTMFETGAAPFLEALGSAAVSDIEVLDEVIAATVRTSFATAALLVAGWGQRLDPLWRTAIVQARQRLAACCLLFNGSHLRLVDTRAPHTRRYSEFDLDAAVDDERCFDALWTLVNAACGHPAAGTASLSSIVTASDRHGASVCRSLRDGVLEASTDVLAALLARRPVPPLASGFEQALTVVYRILFLLFAEARDLVPMWHPVYRRSYSVEALRQSVERRQTEPGLWDALRAINRMAHSGCRAGSLRVPPFNGRLFAPARTPLAERHGLDEAAGRKAVLALSTRPLPGGDGRERISYGDLGVEQLGAVYEMLLDYTPRIATSPRTHPRVWLETGSGLRKATGTFYTPQPLARYLVRQTLGPLVRGASPERILDLKIVDPAMGSGAFLVAAGSFLADAYVDALVERGTCHPGDFGPDERAAIRRTIAERCLYGVDLNPMAVQLARLSLWLATLAGNRPLSFLDHHLQVGDSLLGAWVANLRQRPGLRRSGARRDSLPLFSDAEVTDAVRQALPVRFTLAAEPNDTLEQVRSKERALAALNRPETPVARWRRIANLWCASWFDPDAVPPSAFADVADALVWGRSSLPDRAVDNCLARAQAIADAHRFLHWELEFPEVFFDASGARLSRPGFDAVIGNPPWDMIRADAGDAQERAGTRHASAAVVRFTRDTGIYSSQSDGHANRYQLFVERSVALARAGGRVGLVLPWGLAADHGSRALRRMLFARCDVDAMVSLDNRRRVFPIHRSVRILLLTATNGRPTGEIGCRLAEHDPAALNTEDSDPSSEWFRVRVTPSLLARLSGPEDLAVPELRSEIDLTIAERAASLFAPLGDRSGWHARFGRELNATDDRAAFITGRAGLPVIEGKLIEPFSVRADRARLRIAARDAARLLGTRHEQQRLAYRDVASATNRLTLIAAILPAGSVSTHTVLCLRTPLALRHQQFLCGLFNSFVVNYLARLRVSTHVTTAIVERLPVPPPQVAPQTQGEIAGLARLLARAPDPNAFARLNAQIGRIYRLSREEFAHVLETFPLVPREERDDALAAFDDL